MGGWMRGSLYARKVEEIKAIGMSCWTCMGVVGELTSACSKACLRTKFMSVGSSASAAILIPRSRRFIWVEVGGWVGKGDQ